MWMTGLLLYHFCYFNNRSRRKNFDVQTDTIFNASSSPVARRRRYGLFEYIYAPTIVHDVSLNAFVIRKCLQFFLRVFEILYFFGF